MGERGENFVLKPVSENRKMGAQSVGGGKHEVRVESKAA